MILGYSSKRTTAFEAYVFCFAAVQIVHLIVMTFTMNVPFGLLYGPLLHSIYHITSTGSTFSRRLLTVQFLPFLFFGIWYIITFFQPSKYYFDLAFFSSVLSTFSYCLFLSIKVSQNFKGISDSYILLVRQLVAIGLGASSFCILFYGEIIEAVRLFSEYSFTLALFLFFGTLISFHFLYRSVIRGRKEGGLSPVDAEQNQLTDLYSNHGKVLEKVMLQEELFLNPRLTLADLAEHTAISKSAISDFINLHAQSNYYEWLAKYRIQYALDLLNSTTDQLKMEAIANESGFSSKTVFYRYFKLFVGVSPSAYRSKLIAN